MGLWAAPDTLPFFVVAQPVSKFVCGGADLMLPGVRAISHESMKEGSLAAVKVAGNPLPFAVGVVLFDPSKATAAEGRVLQLLQAYCDGLWEAGGDVRPNAGFQEDQVHPIEGGGSAGGAKMGVTTDVEGAESSASRDGEGRQEANSLEAGEAAVGEEGTGTAEEMDVLLEQCFMQAVRTRIKDKDLPLDVSVLYLQHMRPVRPVGANLDVKRSTFKKLSKFIAFLASEGLVRVAAATKAAPERITSITRAHPKLREFQPLAPEQTFEVQQLEKEMAAVALGAKKDAFTPIEVTNLFRPHESMYGVLFEQDRQAYYSMEQCKHALESYINGEHDKNKDCLIDAIDPSTVILDPFLCDALFQGDKTLDRPLPTHMKRAEINTRYVARLYPWFRISGGRIKKSMVVQGKRVENEGGKIEMKAPGVYIKTDTRRGHNVTLVRGLEILGIDPESFAADMKEEFAAAASIETTLDKDGHKSHEVMFQGFWDKTLASHLLQHYKLPKACLEVKTKGSKCEKAPKHAMNVCRA